MGAAQPSLSGPGRDGPGHLDLPVLQEKLETWNVMYNLFELFGN